MGGKREIQPDARDDAGRLKQRAEMLEALSAPRVEAWRPRLEALTHDALDRLPTDRAVDLLGEFTLPWGLSLAMLVTGADPAGRPPPVRARHPRICRHRADSEDTALRADAAAATAELERIFEAGPIPMGEPAFVALSQTLPRLLANAWLALVRHPTEFARLRAHPDLLPGAIDELLRYAGIVRRVYRRATANVDLGGVTIADGELVVLMLASANRDPEQFPDPDRLRSVAPRLRPRRARDRAQFVRRRDADPHGGRGGHRRARGEVRRSTNSTDVGEWRTGSGFCFPASVFVTWYDGTFDILFTFCATSSARRVGC